MIVLLPNGAFLSETSRMLHIAQALAAQGQAVALGTHGGPYAWLLERAGLPLERLSTTMDAPGRAARFVADVVQIGRPGVQLQPPDELRAQVTAELAWFRRTGARMVVTGFALSAYLSSRLAGIPMAASHGGSLVPPVFERGLAPVPTTMPIPGTEWLPAPLKRWLANNGALRMRAPPAYLNTLAAELGVAPVPTLAAMMVADLTLVTDTPEVLGIPAEAIAAWRPQRHPRAFRPETRLVCTGPLVARLDLPVPAPVQRILDGSRPTAYVALTSVPVDTVRAVVAQVRRSGLRVVVAATQHDFGPAPDAHTVVGGVLPSHRVMPLVDVAVTMGGQGSVQTAMLSGTPLAAIPLHPEQELNAALAARQGMAVPVAPRHAVTPRLAEVVMRLATEPAFRAAARRVQQHYAAWDGPAEAARQICRYLGAAPAPRDAAGPAPGVEVPRHPGVMRA